MSPTLLRRLLAAIEPRFQKRGTQARVARRLGVDEGTVSRWRSPDVYPKNRPSFDDVDALLGALDLSANVTLRPGRGDHVVALGEQADEAAELLGRLSGDGLAALRLLDSMDPAARPAAVSILEAVARVNDAAALAHVVGFLSVAGSAQKR